MKLNTLVHTDKVNTLAILNDQTLASGSWDTTITIWNITNGSVVKTLNGHFNSVECLAVLPSNNPILFSGSFKKIHLWDTINGNLIKTLDAHNDWVLSLVFLSENNRLISGSGDKIIKIWEL